jgi:DNA-binding MarR family transcriptional regulator
VLLALKDASVQWYPSKLAQASGASYVYVTQWLTKLEVGGWVKFERKGRQKIVVLTEKGAAIAQALDELSRKIDPAKPQQTAQVQPAPGQ